MSLTSSPTHPTTTWFTNWLTNWLTNWPIARLQDARLYQILFLALFLTVGLVTRDWTLRPSLIATAIATCLGVQWLACQGVAMWAVQPTEPEPTIAPASRFFPPSFSPLSALITALGLSLLLRADHPSTMALAATIAILSKFLLKIQGKHLFNPANVGLVGALCLTQDAWVSPGQWGEEGWYVLLFLGTGGLVLQKVGRWDTTVAFLGAYAGLEAVRNFWLGWTWDVWAHRLTSGSLLLFALFMITDPRTIPNARLGRLIWAVTIALLTFFLRNTWFVSTAVFWALFVLSPLTWLLDRIFPGDRFSWQQPQPPTEPCPAPQPAQS